jgi:hypothetical protein
MKKTLISFIAVLTVAILSVSSAHADSFSSETVAVYGAGPGLNGIGAVSEDITGGFLFDSTTGVAYDFSLSGTGLISETWNYSGSVTATEWACNLTGPDCAYIQLDQPGSLGDTLPFGFDIFPSYDGFPGYGFVEGGGGLYMDDWGGSVTATPVPEPSTWMLILLGGLAILAVKLKLG